VRKRWLRANSNSFNRPQFGDSSKRREKRLVNKRLSIASSLESWRNQTRRVSEQEIEASARSKIGQGPSSSK